MIVNILKDLNDNTENYKKNIIRAFGLESGTKIKISLLFIYDLDTQKQLDFSSGVKFCIDNKIDYYLFSNDSDNFCVYDEQKNIYIKSDSYIPRNMNLKAIFDNINQKEESQKNKNQNNEEKNPKKKFKTIEDYFKYKE